VPRPSHPCAAIVLSQWGDIPAETRIAHWRRAHQLPEPWVGHIDRAPILFVSSNPSIRGHISPEVADRPDTADGITWNQPDSEIIRRYDRAFDDFIVDGVRSRGARRATRYWASIKRRAQELIPWRKVEPGYDYALTEVVRCKSAHEFGVDDAGSVCPDLHLEPTLRMSGSVVLVGVGSHAKRLLLRHLHLSEAPLQSVDVGGRERLLTFIPHPSAFGGPKSLEGTLSPEDLAVVRHRVASSLSGGSS
jgi:hypothetical protein